MVSSYATLTRQDRTGKSTTQNTTVSIGCRYEAVAPEGKVSALVALNVPKVTAPTLGTAWKQLIGNDIVKVATDLKYDDEYGDLFGQDWCRATYLVADTGDLQIVDCNDLPALLAREAASAPTP